ncbi:MAG TPA: zinc ribbon domain-containing protein [Terriglobales bacterium]|nr:zinc ribbon domain-containing protein [Terriglobales bacterium]
MPLYEYQCKKCKHVFEKIHQSYSDPRVKKCPKCNGPVEQLLSAPAVQFKGSGWYVTDYARKSEGGSSSKNSGSADSGGDSGSSDGSESSASKAVEKTDKTDSKPTAKDSGKESKSKPESKKRK